MTDFKKGDRVRVEFEGEVNIPRNTTGRITIATTSGWLVHLPLESESAIKITLVDPQNWPPQPGDIWEGDGKEWFARTPRIETMFLVPDDQSTAAYTADEFRELNPVLVRRRGQ